MLPKCITASFLACCAGEEKEACHTLFRPCPRVLLAITHQAQRQLTLRMYSP